MKTVKKTVANQCTWVRNQVTTSLPLVNKDLPVKNLQQVFVIFERVQILKV